MKRIFQTLLAITLLGGTLDSNAQEFIKTISGITPDYTIVKETSSGGWLMYSYTTGSSTFCMTYSSGIPTVPVLELPSNVHVNDVELSGNSAYFCGKIYDALSATYQGFLGYFTISNFPNSAVYYLTIDSITEAKKLTLFSVSSTFHAAMVGTGNNGNGYLIDVLQEPNFFSGWSVFIGQFDAPPCTMYDITIAGSRVAVSFKGNNSSIGEVTFFNKPSVLGTSYIGTVLDYHGLSVPTTLKSQVLLERSTADTLYAVYKCGNFGEIKVCRLKEDNIINADWFSALNNSLNCQLNDIYRDRYSKDINILTSSSSGNTPKSDMWYVPRALLQSGGTIYSHSFTNQQVCSLDQFTYIGGNMMLSGKSQTGALQLYKINSNNWTGCTIQQSRQLYNVSKSHYLTESKCIRSYFEKNMITMSVSTRTETITTNCSQNAKDYTDESKE